eukprot:Hpha_TRINITY_DN16221_c0_g3::TRINITY_DN16221_c0_g3_i1::g.12552::m.12552
MSDTRGGALREAPRMWSLAWVLSPEARLPEPPAANIPCWVERRESELYSLGAEWMNLPQDQRMMGIFAKRAIPGGSWLGEYAGVRTPEPPPDSCYVYGPLPDGQHVDARDEEHSNWTRYVNAPAHSTPYPFASDASPGVENCMFVDWRGSDGVYRPYLCARRDIPAGKELLVPYGDEDDTARVCGWAVTRLSALRRISRERFTIPLVGGWVEENCGGCTVEMLLGCRARNGRHRINAEARAAEAMMGAEEAERRGFVEHAREDPVCVLECVWKHRSCPPELRCMIERLSSKRRRVELEGPQGETSTWQAARTGDAATLRALVASGRAEVDKAAEGGVTPCFAAAENGHTDALRVLIAEGAAVDRVTDEGDTPCCAAARNGHAAALRVLIAEGKADACKATEEGVTPCFTAAENGDTESLRVIIAE